MRFDAIVILVACSMLVVSSGREITCSQLINAGEKVNEEVKRKAQLCHLTELADVLDGMASALHEAMIAVLDEQGVSVIEDSNELGKRGNELLRFGKRKHEYLRFGKRKNEYLRFGK